MSNKSKTLARHGSLDEYVDSLPAYEKESIGIESKWLALKDLDLVEVTAINVFDDGLGANLDDICFTKGGKAGVMNREKFLSAHTPCLLVDDTFNDDTVAQTFGDLEDYLPSCRCSECNKSYKLYHNRISIERNSRCRKCFDRSIADTPAQTFGPIEWDAGTQDKTAEICTCLGCKSIIPLDSVEFDMINRGLGCPTCKANASKIRLIGIHGPARAGKDTLASYLLDNLSDDWSRSSFADPIKKMLEVIGVDCSDEAKAVIDDRFCYTPRHMMQTLGTEWGRQTIDNDIWVKAFARLNAGECVIVPDVRFENEAALVREHGVLIHLVGRGGIEGNHVSENAIEFKPGDIVIDNSRDLAWLHGQVDGNAVLGDFISEVLSD